MQVSYLLLFVVPYLVMIAFFIAGWFKKQIPSRLNSNNKPFVSILIPVRNEEKNLPQLLQNLLNQTYSFYEVIFINDHSDDSTSAIIKEHQKLSEKINLIESSDREGKKAALWKGIKSSKGELIITTDGDCTFSENWISAMVEYYILFPGHLLIGPVFMTDRKGFWNQFQNLEYLSLMASAAGSSGIGKPVLCSGANLGGDREFFLGAESVYRSSIASGDDMFLLQHLKKKDVPTVFVKSREAVVVTNNTAGLKKFLNQRSRWTFKSRFYSDIDIIGCAIIVLFTNVFLVAQLFYSLLHPQFFITFLLFYLLKSFVDYILLYNVARFFNRKHLIKYFLIHQLLYIFYISFVGVAGHFIGEKWKARERINT